MVKTNFCFVQILRREGKSSKYFASSDFLAAYLTYTTCLGSGGAQRVASRIQAARGDRHNFSGFFRLPYRKFPYDAHSGAGGIQAATGDKTQF